MPPQEPTPKHSPDSPLSHHGQDQVIQTQHDIDSFTKELEVSLDPEQIESAQRIIDPILEKTTDINQIRQTIIELDADDEISKDDLLVYAIPRIVLSAPEVDFEGIETLFDLFTEMWDADYWEDSQFARRYSAHILGKREDVSLEQLVEFVAPADKARLAKIYEPYTQNPLGSNVHLTASGGMIVEAALWGLAEKKDGSLENVQTFIEKVDSRLGLLDVTEAGKDFTEVWKSLLLSDPPQDGWLRDSLGRIEKRIPIDSDEPIVLKQLVEIGYEDTDRLVERYDTLWNLLAAEEKKTERKYQYSSLTDAAFSMMAYFDLVDNTPAMEKMATRTEALRQKLIGIPGDFTPTTPWGHNQHQLFRASYLELKQKRGSELTEPEAHELSELKTQKDNWLFKRS